MAVSRNEFLGAGIAGSLALVLQAERVRDKSSIRAIEPIIYTSLAIPALATRGEPFPVARGLALAGIALAVSAGGRILLGET